jgi:hypothetical protein
LKLTEPDIPTTPTEAITISIRSLAARYRELGAEAARLEHHIDTVTATAAPRLRAVYGVGPDTAATPRALHRPRSLPRPPTTTNRRQNPWHNIGGASGIELGDGVSRQAYLNLMRPA